MQDGAFALITDDTFATAEAYDEDQGRYLGLKVGGGGPSAPDNNTCIVKVDVGRRQQEEDAKQGPIPPVGPAPHPQGGGEPPGPVEPVGPEPTPPPVTPTKPSIFVGSVKLSGARVGRDAGRIADEVLSHLTALSGAQASVTMEIEIKVPNGVDDDIVRIVSENANSLKFTHASFEKE
jgi:hypothetical protein